MLEIKNIYKTFNAGTVNEKRALKGVNLTLEDGDFVTVIGGNGAGKSTLLNAIAGVWPVDVGEIIIDGKVVNDIPASERGIGFVFQSYALFRYMTVYDNVAFGLKIQKADKKIYNYSTQHLESRITMRNIFWLYNYCFYFKSDLQMGICTTDRKLLFYVDLFVGIYRIYSIRNCSDIIWIHMEDRI